ncbi:MAG: hypothetical protein KBB86_00735 [Candidatus Pacebacteria bacterium]|nr:hypothetical protein [Candidatus Paceibacterota bacterium]
MENTNNNSQKWYKTSKGKAVIFLLIMFFLSRNFLLGVFILPIAYGVKKGDKGAFIAGGIYSLVMTLVNCAIYVSSKYDVSGKFSSSLTPIYLYVILCVVIIKLLISAHKESKG